MDTGGSVKYSADNLKGFVGYRLLTPRSTKPKLQSTAAAQLPLQEMRSEEMSNNSDGAGRLMMDDHRNKVGILISIGRCTKQKSRHARGVKVPGQTSPHLSLPYLWCGRRNTGVRVAVRWGIHPTEKAMR